MDKKRKASGISGGIFLIGLGVLLFTGWWWPGILLVIGLSGGAEQIFRGQTVRGIGTIAFFSAIPIVIAIVQSTDISWGIVGPFILIVLGVITLVKTFFLKDEVEEVADIEKTDRWSS
ncbi:MAG: hypothetical protein E3J30_06125 [Anaerolineales bacterium]|nr:MAG: hypothetical protein E3J30_06125 [Anaerolineales bacterium]